MTNYSESVELTKQDFSDAFGESVDPVTEAEIAAHDFTLERITGKARDSLVIEILEKIREDKQIIGDPTRDLVWATGWQENLDGFKANSDAVELVPRFIRPGQPVRWQGQFFRPVNPNFEESFTRVLRSFIFGKINKELGGGSIHLHEFGAGTGWNLLHAHDWFRKIGRSYKLFGSDFVDSAVELMNIMGREKGLPLTARHFDMRLPDFSYEFEDPSSSGVFTLGALEQLAGELEPMIDYLLSQRPRIVIHVEPAIENYDVTTLEDFLAVWFQGKRGYSRGLEALLRAKEGEGKLDVLQSKRIGFGSMMMEGYNLFIWRPRGFPE